MYTQNQGHLGLRGVLFVKTRKDLYSAYYTNDNILKSTCAQATCVHYIVKKVGSWCREGM
jgi:hypothetical protein